MTAEEKGLVLFDAWLEDKGDDESYWVAAVAAAIRSAEAAAYERAAKAIDAACEDPGLLNDGRAIIAPGDLADRVRSLSPKETP